jgi:Uncharacterized protein conserved in bacteria (DUF2188)
MRGWVHTVYRGGCWVNEVEGAAQLLARYWIKEEAVAAGRQEAIARKTEHVIHRIDGTIAERNSYGHDPFPPRG